ncbi:MAG: hypothetical protein FK733_07595 [Asgard group archaeon]|nr:hypothetical protein [Asgard group archaeon]
MLRLKSNYLQHKLTVVIVAISLITALNFGLFSGDYVITNAQQENQFPYSGQYMHYDITQTTGGFVTSSGSLTLTYHHMLNATTIFGSFHVEVLSLIAYYNETAIGTENINTRNLFIDADDTEIIYLFMVYFFEFNDGVTRATPMWIFPEDMQKNRSIEFWNYTATCDQSQSISILDHYYEVFVFRIFGSMLNMTMMYGYAKHGESDWYGVLFYMSGTYYEPDIDRRMTAYFRISSTNLELRPLEEINTTTIFSITASFYSIVIVGTIVYRLKTRKELIGGEV